MIGFWPNNKSCTSITSYNLLKPKDRKRPTNPYQTSFPHQFTTYLIRNKHREAEAEDVYIDVAAIKADRTRLLLQVLACDTFSVCGSLSFYPHVSKWTVGLFRYLVSNGPHAISPWLGFWIWNLKWKDFLLLMIFYSPIIRQCGRLWQAINTSKERL